MPLYEPFVEVPGVWGSVLSGALGLSALLTLLAALHRRAQLKQLAAQGLLTTPPAASDAGDGEPPQHLLVTSAACALTDDQRAQLLRSAQGCDAELIDLVPPLSALHAEAFYDDVLTTADPKARFAQGISAGWALLVSRPLAARAGFDPDTTHSPATLAKAALRLKTFCARPMAWWCLPDAPRLRLSMQDQADMVALKRGWFGKVELGTQAAALAVTVGLALAAPVEAALAVLASHVAPLIVAQGSPHRLRAGDALACLLARTPWRLAHVARLLLTPMFSFDAAQIAQRRPETLEAIRTQAHAWTSPPLEACPMCGAAALRPWVQAGDLITLKPGTFHLQRCGACAYVFQNPCLTPEGLAFYYTDVYDGLNLERTFRIFSMEPETYAKRAQLLPADAEAARWLDVGCGHGHFCRVARDLWPDTRFEGLDLSDGVDEAHARGWIADKHRGLFTALAPELAGRFDVVSMGHYLEHTLDPRAELRAAHTALAEGGHLLLEMPSPAPLRGRLLGRYWPNWIQPQHLHMIARGHMETLLREAGFEPVAWEDDDTTGRLTFALSLALLLERLAPTRDYPWLPAPTWATALRRACVWAPSPVWFALALMCDLGWPVWRRLDAATAYRVVARKA